MAIPTFDDDLKIISKLGDEPGADNGLSPSEFKDKFDEAALLIQNYINKKLLGELNSLIDVQSLLNNILDSTLTQLDKAANAKATGDQLKTKLSLTGGTMTGHVTVLAPTQDNHPATKTYVDTALSGLHFTARLTLPAASWAGSGPYTQQVSLPGIRDTDCPHYGPVYGEAWAGEKEAFALVDKLETGENTLTFTCFEEKPEVDLNLILEVNRGWASA